MNTHPYQRAKPSLPRRSHQLPYARTRKARTGKPHFAVTSTPQRFGNMLLGGGGAETLQDRGSRSFSSARTLNPYFNGNIIFRWQEYVRWYMTAWEAKKIIDIPVEDALRKPVEIYGLDEYDQKSLEEACASFNVEKQIRRALTQERLLGGAVILPIFDRPESEETSSPLDYRTLKRGDLRSFNIIDVSKLSRPAHNNDPFSPTYDAVGNFLINGVNVHTSRLCLLDGGALFSRSSQGLLESGRSNPCGFGESRLAPLYDLLNRVVGTQQGAYHLVNMASCLLIEVDQLRSVMATSSPAMTKLMEVVEQLNIYRGAVIDAKGAKISQHSAAFGSVPELVMTFAQLLSAASDIPATRFLGQAPGGFNPTGAGDLENYYNMIAAYQQLTIRPVQRKCIDMVGATLWGWSSWKEKSRQLELVYPPLWNCDESERAKIDDTYASLLKSLCQGGVISTESAFAELKRRGIFMTDIQAFNNDNSLCSL